MPLALSGLVSIDFHRGILNLFRVSGKSSYENSALHNPPSPSLPRSPTNSFCGIGIYFRHDSNGAVVVNAQAPNGEMVLSLIRDRRYLKA